MPLDQAAATKLIALRHPEWSEHQLRWRWLLDSLEGGERYRQAVYGSDRRGQPIRNLIRHKREYPDPRELPGAGRTPGAQAIYLAGTANGLAGGAGSLALGQDQAQYATDDDYELRRARTPIPTFVPEAVDTYTSKIFAKEVKREAPEGAEYDRLREWWEDVDGRGTCMDDWVEHVIGRLLLALGQIDLIFDHPPAPNRTIIVSERDAIDAGIKVCVAGYILPDNMLWWKLDERGKNYLECLVQEYAEGGEGLAGIGFGPNGARVSAAVRYRHWTATGWALYGADGKTIDSDNHHFGCVPIVRIFDRRKLRCRNVGQSRLESVAERQREYYNRDSELILSDTIQAHPLLQGPDDYCGGDQTLPIGPNYLLPKKKSTTGTSVSYEGFEVIDFPKGAAESLRENKKDIRDDVDRDAKLTKPAGVSGTGKGTVGQSGVSKELDHEGLHSVLSQVAKMLALAESQAAQMALAVLFDGKPPKDAEEVVKISYPTVFNLHSADELATITTDLQGILAASGDAPDTETMLVCEVLRKALPGRDDETYEGLDKEIAATIKAKAKAIKEAAEAGALLPQDKATASIAGPNAEVNDGSIDDPSSPEDEN